MTNPVAESTESVSPTESASLAERSKSIIAKWSSDSRGLMVLAISIGLLYFAMALLSRRFNPWNGSDERPVLTFLAIYFAAFVLYCMAALIAIRIEPSRRTISTIWISGLIFRMMLIPSIPILEIDIYRYLWDGAVCRVGQNPYQHSPERVELANASSADPDSLRRLANLRDSDPAYASILSRIHYEHLTTIYPPVSQAVFAMASASTPPGSSVPTHVTVMKFWLTLFDIGTFALVISLARQMKWNANLAILYGWCPLVIKEIAGSGHLDSIAVFFSTLSVYSLIRFAQQYRETTILTRIHARTLWLVLLVFAFALAVGAKLYPIVIGPIFLAVVIRCLGWWRGTAVGLVAISLSLLIVWPLVGDSLVESNKLKSSAHAIAVREPVVTDTGLARQGHEAPPTIDGTPPAIDEAPPAFEGNPPVPNSTIELDPVNSSGLQMFFRSWEMNDLAFMFVLENLRPDRPGTTRTGPWFVIVPNDTRRRVDEWLTERYGEDEREPAFRFTRTMSLAMVAFVAAIFFFQLLKKGESEAILRGVFLLLAFFWATSPTQNPWYWLWCLPFIIAMSNRGWWLTSGFVGLYYLRFWLLDHFGDERLPGSAYEGDLFFYFVIVPIEHGLWIGAVLIGAIVGWRKRQSGGDSSTEASLADQETA